MALTKVTSAGIKDGELVNADLHSAANIVGTKLADDTIAEVKLDVSNAPIAGTFLQYKDNSDQLTWAAASSPEVYGFKTTGSELQVTTTNGGADNISGTVFDTFEDVVFAATGFSFSVNANGKLIATI
tara:strand:+ start:1350 stop:1733 length:384 start_codon:yes stop_codon:yes gene_type:complete